MLPLALRNYRPAKVKEVRIISRGMEGFISNLRGHLRKRSETRQSLGRGPIRKILDQMPYLRSCSQEKLVEDAQIFALHLLQKHSRRDPEKWLLGLACVAVAAERTLRISPYPVQLCAAYELCRGALGEMATGEGKTLSIGLAATLMGLTRLPCHILTANNYLTERDAQELAPLYQYFGLKVGCVLSGHGPSLRRQAYAQEITYTTAKEVLADFLRDRLKVQRPFSSTRELIRHLTGFNFRSGALVQRGLHYAILDEADTLLIDEAVTPLIISQVNQDDQLAEALTIAHRIIAQLKTPEHYTINRKFRDVHIFPQVWTKLMPLVSQFPPWWRSTERFREAIRTSLLARDFYHRDVHYAVLAEKVEIIDESTGRIMEERTWQQGLHQAIEIKEQLPPTKSTNTLASLSFQRYFRCYPHLAGLSGTARQVASQIWHYYQLPLVKIPTHRPLRRHLCLSQLYSTKKEKWNAVLIEIKNTRKQDRPVLVGTRSVQASEELALLLTKEKIPFTLLNAKCDATEAATIAQAGQPGQVTLATNMAGRGTDIKLHSSVAQRGGLHVIITERNESRRIDRQLLGRAARQGDPGSGIHISSIEDDLLAHGLPVQLLGIIAFILRKPCPSVLVHRLEQSLASIAQRGKETQARLQSRSTVQHDQWLDEHLTYGGRSTLV